MQLFIILVAIGVLHFYGPQSPIHRDRWYFVWVKWIDKYLVIMPSAARLGLALAIPVLLLWACCCWLVSISPWLLLPLGVLVLSYSFGRGDFHGALLDYDRACDGLNWEQAAEYADRLGLDVKALTPGDWSALHTGLLEHVSYRGFERIFAVLFWFFLLGPVAAFAYRLLFLHVSFFNFPDQVANDRAKDDAIAAETADTEGVSELGGGDALASGAVVKSSRAWAERLLWLVEWPAVRVLGLSFALAGNFVGCFQRLLENLFCFRTRSAVFLNRLVLGALSVDDVFDHSCEVTRKELILLNKLYKRTIWLWLALASLFVVFT